MAAISASQAVTSQCCTSGTVIRSSSLRVSPSARVIASLSSKPRAWRVAKLVVEASADGKDLSAAAQVSNRSGGKWAAALAAVNAFVLANPVLAEAVEAVVEAEEKGKIFDFNLTLPIITIEFLLLMVILDKIWFTPVGKVMDERDAEIRSKLEGVRDNSAQIKELQDEAEAIIKAARVETAAAMLKMKKETAAALDEKLQQSRERIEKELAIALANLERQKEDTLKSLDDQVKKLSEEILAKVIPFKI